MAISSIMPPRNLFRRRLLLGDENDENQALDDAAGNDGGMDESPKAAWRTVEILQEGRLMAQTSISALLGAGFAVFPAGFIPQYRLMP